MWIQTNNEATEKIYNNELMDEPVEFSDNNTANVSEAVGEALIEQYDGIAEYDNGD